MQKRSHRADVARETLVICQAGWYHSPSGQRVRIADELEYARSQTRVYPANAMLPPAVPGTTATTFEVTGETTLEATRRLDSALPGCDPACLNFASAKNPGGGFLGGAQAQEESLARSSGLYPCIACKREMYDYNRSRSTCLYSDTMLYSPRVPVFRDDDGTLLESPYVVSFITAPAVNAGAVKQDERHLIESTMRQRAERVLRVAHQHGHRTLVLGAWGCGVFRNDPEMVAQLFAELFHSGSAFHDVFAHVVFAVFDRSDKQTTLEAFRSRFASRGSVS